MRWSVLLVSLGASAAPLAAAAQESRFEYTQVHLGVAVRLVLYAPDPGLARRAAAAAFARIAALEDKMSDYRPASEVSRLGHPAGQGAWTPASRELFAVLARALEVARASGGAFDPTVGPLVMLWRETRRAGRLPDSTTLAAARARVGWSRIALDSARQAVRLEPGTVLDLGGIAKGYILGQALETLRAEGVDAALFEAGGDVVVSEAPPERAGWVVQADTALMLRHAALATSGGTGQFVEIGGVRYGHVVDPGTGLGVTAPRVVSVRARDAALADALATALVVLGPDSAAALLDAYPGVAVWWR